MNWGTRVLYVGISAACSVFVISWHGRLRLPFVHALVSKYKTVFAAFGVKRLCIMLMISFFGGDLIANDRFTVCRALIAYVGNTIPDMKATI